VDQDHADLLRRLAINDERALECVLRTSLSDDSEGRLGARTVAIARLAALIALHPAPASLHWATTAALSAGATEDDVVDVLAAVAPIVGVARVSWAAPELLVDLELDSGDG
jgi:4-carboxymuconolactone decarboxylase